MLKFVNKELKVVAVFGTALEIDLYAIDLKNSGYKTKFKDPKGLLSKNSRAYCMLCKNIDGIMHCSMISPEKVLTNTKFETCE